MDGVTQGEPMRVKVTAADCNLALWPSADTFDGSPFSEWPRWLTDAIGDGRIRPHTRGGTDYAQWDVSTPHGMVSAEPGDEIARDLRVFRHIRTELTGTSADRMAAIVEAAKSGNERNGLTPWYEQQNGVIKRAHEIDIRIRKDAVDYWIEGDFLKGLARAIAPPAPLLRPDAGERHDGPEGTA